MATYIALVCFYLFFGVVASSVLRVLFSDKLYGTSDTWLIVVFFVASLILSTIGIISLGQSQVAFLL